MQEPAVTPQVDADHLLLAEIVSGVAASGWHAKRWGTLRQSVFPGENGWQRLKDWCTSQSLECQLAYGQSSRSTDVMFRKKGSGPRSLPQ